MNDRLTKDLLETIKEKIKTDEIDQAEQLLGQLLSIHPEGIYARALAESVAKIRNSRPKSVPVLPSPSPPPSGLPVVDRTIKSITNGVNETRPRSGTSVPPLNPELLTKAEVIIDAWQEGSKIVSAIFSAYRRLLVKTLEDGSITPEEMQALAELRGNLDITPAQHAALEREVRISMYLNAIRIEYRNGGREYSSLRKQFGVETEETHYLSAREESLIQSCESKAVLLLVDDDARSLMMMNRILSAAGYFCHSCASAEEALELIDTVQPDLVVCDLAFGPTRMNGFTFYQKFRRCAGCLHSPFIIVSGVGQDSMVKAAKKLGVDDYLTKPISAPMLVSAVEGKLRRSIELRV